MIKEAEAREFNEAFIDMVKSGHIKEAAEATNDYTRVFIREESFVEKILPARQISNNEFDRRLDDSKMWRIEDLQPGSPGAMSVPFAQLPMTKWMRGKRYAVLFDRIQSHQATVDVDELRTWRMDLRQVIADDYIKDIAYEKDRKFITTVDDAVSYTGAGTVNVTGSNGIIYKCKPATVGNGETADGLARSYKLVSSAGISRDALVDMLKIMPAQSSKLEPKLILCNHLTIKDIVKWGRDEMGGDFAEELVRNGWTQNTFLGYQWMTTIKTDLVPNNMFYMFAPEDYLGKHYLVQDVTMFIEQKAYFLKFYAYTTAGASIGNINGVASCIITSS